MALSSVSFRVPASTSNLGPGFDTLGLALNLYNVVTVSLAEQPVAFSDMVQSAVDLFFREAAQGKVVFFAFDLKITGNIPVSRGLGSSVTVRLGLLLSLAELVRVHQGLSISREEVLAMVITLEGHPDNAVPSCLGGFAICSHLAQGGYGHTRVEIDPTLSFITLIPDLELSTDEARRLLPAQIPFRHAVENMQNTSRIAACMALRRYEDLRGLFRDHLHQPFRQVLIPGFMPILQAATEVGALGSFLSGSGSTLMAVSLSHEEAIAKAMQKCAQAYGLSTQCLILKADNLGARFVASFEL